jgi:hypothetical protein
MTEPGSYDFIRHKLCCPLRARQQASAYFSTCEWQKEAAPDFARRFDELSMALGAQARRVSQLQDVVSER